MKMVVLFIQPFKMNGRKSIDLWLFQYLSRSRSYNTSQHALPEELVESLHSPLTIDRPRLRQLARKDLAHEPYQIKENLCPQGKKCHEPCLIRHNYFLKQKSKDVVY